MDSAAQILFVVSGPSGSGKESVMGGLIERLPDLARIRTYTTRPMRVGESEGRPYRFVESGEFERLCQSGDIFESETVYGSHRYGSPRSAVEGTDDGDLLIELDPHGYRRLRAARTSPTVGLFLLVPDIEELRKRILQRQPEADVETRLQLATEQIREASDYDYILLNDDLQQCVEDAVAVCTAERLRRQGAALRRRVAGS